MPQNRQNPFSSRPPRQESRVIKPTRTYAEADEADDEFEHANEHQVFGIGLDTADERQPAYGQGIVVSLLAAGALLLLAIITFGDGDGTDPPIFHRAGKLYWIIAAVSLLLTAAGAQYAERVAARAAADADGETGRPATGLSSAWAVPAVSIFAAVVLTATFHNRWMLLLGPIIAFLGTAGALLSRDLLDEADADSIRVAATMHTIVVHAIAFLAFSGIYLNKFSSPVSAPIVALISGILLLDMLERAGIGSTVRIGMAVLCAWIMALTTMALNWWPTWGWTGGAVLLAVFYAVAGLLQVRAEQRPVRKRELAEFLGVGGIALTILALRDVIL